MYLLRNVLTLVCGKSGHYILPGFANENKFNDLEMSMRLNVLT